MSLLANVCILIRVTFGCLCFSLEGLAGCSGDIVASVVGLDGSSSFSYYPRTKEALNRNPTREPSPFDFKF
jgi:hypothetical protein